MSRETSVSTPVRSAFSAAKPKALRAGAHLAVFAPASPATETRVKAGLAELARLGFVAKVPGLISSDGYFAASAQQRRNEFLSKLADRHVDGLVGLRGGYGSNYLLDQTLEEGLDTPKALIGFSDLTSLQVYLWQRRHWITFYGPMLAAGLDAGAGVPNGYDEKSLRSAVSAEQGWTISLRGESLVPGEAEGRVVGGALTLIEATIGTPWELDTRDAILLLEDRAMKPYQIDRVLMHLKQARKLDDLRGIILGDFPECEPPIAGSPCVRDVCARILGSRKVPVVFGASVGHTLRPMLTIPLGVRARLHAQGEGALEILEPAVIP
jgi:muramoyltetrapeptide carboxypeptidase